MPSPTSPISNRIREARLAAGLTQDSLAAKLGTTRQVIIKWEKGEIRNPRVKSLQGIAEATGTTVQDLLADEPLTSTGRKRAVNQTLRKLREPKRKAA